MKSNSARLPKPEPLEFKPDLGEAAERWDAFWAGVDTPQEIDQLLEWFVKNT